MDRLNSLPRNHVLKELQTYEKYQGNTQKEISNQFNSIADMRSELYKLEQKTDKNTKIKPKAKSKKYKTNKSEKIEDTINHDVLYNIMLHSDSHTIKNLYLTNQMAKTIGNDKQFWVDKFKQLNILSTPNLNELERYEKTKSIGKNIIVLMKLENEKYVNLRIDFEQNDILPYLPVKFIDEIKKEVDDDELKDELPSIIYNYLYGGSKKVVESDYSHIIYIGLFDDEDNYNININYVLYTEYEIVNTTIYMDEDQIIDFLTRIMYAFPSSNVKYTDSIDYTPNILFDFKESALPTLRKSIQFRYKYWKSKQWFL